MRFLDAVPLSILVIVSLTLGLAPYVPQPHLVEKLLMLISGDLVRPVDIFDLLLHGSPVALLFLKIFRMLLTEHRKLQ